jgi:hypothetical protein
MTIETVERGRLTGVTAVHQLVLFVAVWCLVSFTVSPRAYLDLTAWHLAMMTLASPVIVVIALGVPSLIAGWDSPVRYVHDKVNSRWANALFVAVGFALCLAAFSTLKTTFPEVVPFWADKWLANADKSLYGHSPWRFAHAAVGRFWAGWLFNAYEYLWTLEWLCVPIALAFCASVRTQLRYYWALALTFVIGGLIVAAIFSSGGPIFYDRILGSTRFAELDAKLIGLVNIGLVLGLSLQPLSVRPRRSRQRHFGHAQHACRRRLPERLPACLHQQMGGARRLAVCRGDHVWIRLYRLALFAGRLCVDPDRFGDLVCDRPLAAANAPGLSAALRRRPVTAW